MKDRHLARHLSAMVALLLPLACGPEPASASDEAQTEGHGPAGSVAAADELPGERLELEVLADETTHVDLDRARVLKRASAETTDWDLAFRGWEVFTNGGASGPGEGAAFGPGDAQDFLADTAPEVPFLQVDRTGGAFLDWYAYDGSSHQLWSRHHVYGVRKGERWWKLQILGYYGERFGAPVSGLYRVRYAEVGEQGSGPTQEVTDLDATAAYPEVNDDAPSGCLVLDSGEVLQLTPREATASSAWDLCFRRDAISVNGEQGGPGDVAAVDLDANSGRETLEEVQQRTPEDALEAFEAVAHERLAALELAWRGDRVVSVFDDDWFRGRGKAATPVEASWLVQGADGQRLHLVRFLDLQGTSRAAGEVTLQVRRVEPR